MAGVGLGERFGEWLEDVYERIGLKDLTESNRSQIQDWQAIQTLGDLETYVDRYGAMEWMVITAKAKQLGASSDHIKKMVAPWVDELIDDPSRFIGSQLQQAMQSPAWHELNEIFGAVVFDPWLASIVGERLSPSASEIERVRRFLGTQTSFEALGTVISLLGEIASLGQVENAGKMFSDAKWLLGTCFTSWQSTSPIVEAVILKPLQRLINAEFRPADFTRAQWMDLMALGKISYSRLGEELARMGYDSEKIGWLIDLAERQPSKSELLSMWRKGIISPTLFVEGLRREGYAQEWIDRFLKLYQTDEGEGDKGAYLGTLRKAFKEQLIDESRLRQELAKQGRSPSAIDLEIAVLKLDWEVEEKTAAKSDIRSAYMEDIIGKPEARQWLLNAGFVVHTVNLLLDTWDKQRAPTYRKINKAEILAAWGAGVLSRPEAFQRLLDVGYDSSGATIVLETYARTALATKPPEVYQLKPTDIMWAWHTEVLGDAEAVSRLRDLGLTDRDAQIVFETFRRLHPRIVAEVPRELYKDDILEAWGRGVITQEQALAKLIDVGYSADDAAILITSFAQRPEALPPEPTIAQLIGATRRGIITVAVFSQRLTTMGLKAEDVQFYVSYATTPLPETTRPLSRTDILKLWVEGKHDRAWALERLLSLNYSPEDAEDILWLASPEIEDTETYVLWKAGLIDDDIARAMWLTMGFTEAQIDAVIGAMT